MVLTHRKRKNIRVEQQSEYDFERKYWDSSKKKKQGFLVKKSLLFYVLKLSF